MWQGSGNLFFTDLEFSADPIQLPGSWESNGSLLIQAVLYCTQGSS